MKDYQKPGDFPKTYTVFFAVFGRKMKTNVIARSEDEAKQKVLEKVFFHKIVVDKNDKDLGDILNDMNDFINKL